MQILRQLNLVASYYRTWFLSLRLWGGFLFARFLSLQRPDDFLGRIGAMFWDGPTYLWVICWIALFHVIATLGLTIYRIGSRRRHRREEFFRKYRSARLADWRAPKQWVPLDEVFEICFAPNLLEPPRLADSPNGWESDRVILTNVGTFQLPPDLAKARNGFLERLTEEARRSDGTKYVLLNDPYSHSDELILRLEVAVTTWSAVKVALRDLKSSGWNWLASKVDPNWKIGDRPRIDLAKSCMPSSLCLHGIVITSDRKILAIQRPEDEKTDYHPLAWSFSFEEQLASVDFSGSHRADATQWLTRAVRQEILGGETAKYFDIKRARFLACGLEEGIFNPFLVAFIPVSCSSYELPEIMRNAPDRVEWTDIKFFGFDPPYKDLKEAFNSGAVKLHPTSRYRTYLALSALLWPMPVEDLWESKGEDRIQGVFGR